MVLSRTRTAEKGQLLTHSNPPPRAPDSMFVSQRRQRSLTNYSIHLDLVVDPKVYILSPTLYLYTLIHKSLSLYSFFCAASYIVSTCPSFFTRRFVSWNFYPLRGTNSNDQNLLILISLNAHDKIIHHILHEFSAPIYCLWDSSRHHLPVEPAPVVVNPRQGASI